MRPSSSYLNHQIIVIIAPPPSVAYPFILDVEGYPGQIINFFVVTVSDGNDPFTGH